MNISFSRAKRIGQAGVLGLSLLGASCDSSAPMEEQPPPPIPEVPFEPVSAASYTAKVKNLLTGLAATDEEVQAVTADPAALKGLIDQWTATPQAQAKLLDFFKIAFQQTQIAAPDLIEILGGTQLTTDGNATTARIMQSLQESFARTALQMMQEGRPFTEVVTTNRFQLNTALMVLLAYNDTELIKDGTTAVTDRIDQRIKAKGKTYTFKRTQTGAAVPVSQSVDENSANFMVWTDTGAPFANETNATCKVDPVTATGVNASRQLLSFLFGRRSGCAVTTRVITDADFADWRWVTVRTPKTGEIGSQFYDVGKLRTASEMVLFSPKVGFMTTLAFQANWPTNASNLHRVTMNQTAIVALGHSFDDTLNNNLAITDESALEDDKHVSQATCNACHRSLDPMKNFFRQTYTLRWGLQENQTIIGDPAMFLFDGVTMSGSGIDGLATSMAAHPRFPKAWVQKLCYYANSAPCTYDDPEFERISKEFVNSGFKFNVLLREAFSSPLVTLAARTKTFTENEQPVSISRREHLCSALSNRLGLTDVCGTGSITMTTLQNQIIPLSLSVPSSAYSRGGEAPVVTRDPNLFFRSSTETICRRIGDEIIDKGTTPRYKSTASMDAIDDFTKTVMALAPSDPRYTAARQILLDHYNGALAVTGAKAVDALKSTFILACSSPTSVAIGL